MVFIWRGAGIIVPIILFICGWIVSFWVDDTRLGNAHFMGWTLFYAALMNLVIGLALLGMSDEPKNLEPGEVPVKRRHDFFWIPVFVWGLIFGGFSAYLLMTGGDSNETESTEVEWEEDEPVYGDDRMINFYNPTGDSMSYFIQDRADFLESEYVGPYAFEQRKYNEDTYLIAGFDYDDNIQLSLSDDDFIDDEDKYIIVEVEKEDGSTKRIYHRIVNPQTLNKSDYDEAWIVLTGMHDLVLVDVSLTCSDTIKRSNIEAIDWLDKVEKRYDGRDMIEPLYDVDPGHKQFTVKGPGETIPLEIGKREVVYALIPILHDQKLTNEYLIEKIIEVTF